MSELKTTKTEGQDGLVKTSAEAAIELTEAELKQVAAGRKAGDKPLEYLKVELENVLISS